MELHIDHTDQPAVADGGAEGLSSFLHERNGKQEAPGVCLHHFQLSGTADRRFL